MRSIAFARKSCGLHICLHNEVLVLSYIYRVIYRFILMITETKSTNFVRVYLYHELMGEAAF